MSKSILYETNISTHHMKFEKKVNLLKVFLLKFN